MLEVFIATFILVFLKAIQQQNVIGGHYRLVPAVSFGMAAAEITIIIEVATTKSYWMILPMGIGGGIGAVLAMYIHRRWITERD